MCSVCSQSLRVQCTYGEIPQSSECTFHMLSKQPFQKRSESSLHTYADTEMDHNFANLPSNPLGTHLVPPRQERPEVVLVEPTRALVGTTTIVLVRVRNYLSDRELTVWFGNLCGRMEHLQRNSDGTADCAVWSPHSDLSGVVNVGLALSGDLPVPSDATFEWLRPPNCRILFDEIDYWKYSSSQTERSMNDEHALLEGEDNQHIQQMETDEPTEIIAARGVAARLSEWIPYRNSSPGRGLRRSLTPSRHSSPCGRVQLGLTAERFTN